METSRAEVGSSRTRNVGSRAIARAMATRCAWPPLIWCGIRSKCSSPSPTSRNSSITRAFFSSPRSLVCVTNGSDTMSLMFMRGLSEVEGF